MRNIETGNAAVYAPVERIGCPACASSRDEHFAGYVVDRLRVGVSEAEQQTILHPSLKASLQRVVDRIAAIGPSDHRSPLRMQANPVHSRIQLLVDELAQGARADVRGVQYHAARQLALDAEIPRPGHRVEQARVNRRYRG